MRRGGPLTFLPLTSYLSCMLLLQAFPHHGVLTGLCGVRETAAAAPPGLLFLALGVVLAGGIGLSGPAEGADLRYSRSLSPAAVRLRAVYAAKEPAIHLVPCPMIRQPQWPQTGARRWMARFRSCRRCRTSLRGVTSKLLS